MSGICRVSGGALDHIAVRAFPKKPSLVRLLVKVLTCNNFDFNDRHFLQVGGNAMGSKVAPSYANTFMGCYEEKYVYD